MLNTYDLDRAMLVKLLAQSKILTSLVENQMRILAGNAAEAQRIIDQHYYRMPDLIPVQFHFMLNKYGFDDAIAILLPALKDENLDKFAMYKAYLDQARFYEFSKALAMFTDIKDKFAAIDESLDFTLEQLKAMWLEASKK